MRAYRFADAWDLLKLVRATSRDDVSDRCCHRAYSFGCHLVRAELERILVLELEHIGNLLEYPGYFGVVDLKPFFRLV